MEESKAAEDLAFIRKIMDESSSFAEAGGDQFVVWGAVTGLGMLGSLPKMDFGLELLYGATEGKQPDAPVAREDSPSDLTIRGTVKHKF